MQPPGTEKDGIFIDSQAVNNSGQTNVDGISHIGNGLNDGKCSIRIESITETDFGKWSCTLMSKSGQVFTGNVTVQALGKSLGLHHCLLF